MIFTAQNVMGVATAAVGISAMASTPNARPKKVQEILENCQCVGQLSVGGHVLDCLEMNEIESVKFRESIVKESQLFQVGLLRIENTKYNQGAKMKSYRITVPPPKTECSGMSAVNTCSFNPENLSIYKNERYFYTKAIGGDYTLCLREFISTEWADWVSNNVNDISSADDFRSSDFGGMILDKVAQGFNASNRLDKLMMMSINGSSDTFANCDYGFLPKLMFASNGQYYAANKYDLSKAEDGQIITIHHGAVVNEYTVGADGTIAEILEKLATDVESFETVDCKKYYSATYDETAQCLTVVHQYATQEIYLDIYVSDDPVDISSQCRRKVQCLPEQLQCPMNANDAPLQINYQKPSKCNFYQYMMEVDNHWQCYLSDNDLMDKVDWNQRRYLIDPKMRNTAMQQIKMMAFQMLRGSSDVSSIANECVPNSVLIDFECFRNTGLFIGTFPNNMIAFTDGTLENGKVTLPNIKVRESKCNYDQIDIMTKMTIGMAWDCHALGIHNACGSPYEKKLEGKTLDDVTKSNIPCYCPENCASRNTTMTSLSASYNVTSTYDRKADTTGVTVMIMPSTDNATFTGVLSTGKGTALQADMNAFTATIPGNQTGNVITVKGSINGNGTSSPLFFSKEL